jgi:hypothetical protein
MAERHNDFLVKETGTLTGPLNQQHKCGDAEDAYKNFNDRFHSNFLHGRSLAAIALFSLMP